MPPANAPPAREIVVTTKEELTDGAISAVSKDGKYFVHISVIDRLVSLNTHKARKVHYLNFLRVVDRHERDHLTYPDISEEGIRIMTHALRSSCLAPRRMLR